ncbi:hypothetical protein GSI_00849 [Ganoderma sinense ZZ0214-1]|uniref:Uncharacterized protein n=1 Tax=Ganoderma sinense ZZ0214-1 TaxID=1077348 RepID=A0A2G8STQ9_9APHY|nr:hypothetical protein GSI_00849 [Ganoderma sinense ZZ0214-1]
METQGNVDRQSILRATEARLKTLREKTPSRVLYMPHDEEHDRRQAFRKQADYILGANKPAQAIESLKAEDYSSCYVYSAKTYNTLRTGSAIIEEILEREIKKQETEVQRRQKEEEEQKELIEKLRNQFFDDRKSVAVRVQRERETGVQEKGLPRRKGAPLTSNIVTLHG